MKEKKAVTIIERKKPLPGSFPASLEAEAKF
jgi:hypothetical protein